MGELILFAVLITIVGVVSIEFGRTRKDFVKAVGIAALITMQGVHWSPAWYGYLTLALGVAGFIWSGVIYQSPDDQRDIRRDLQAKMGLLAQTCYVWLKSSLSAVARGSGRAFEDYRKLRKARAPARTVNRIKLWPRTLLLVAVSPVLAIPAMLLMVMLLWFMGEIVADNSMPNHGMSGLPKFLLGTTVVYWIVTLDLIFRYLLVCLPLLVAAGYWGTLLATRQRAPWRYYSLASLALAVLYPLMFLAASVAGEFNEPFFS